MTIYQDRFSVHVLHMSDQYNHDNIDIQMMLNFFQHMNLDYHMDFLDKHLI
jgi:hypothetical protein